MDNHVFFFIGIALILTHEMDAIRCKEWRIFPVVSNLDDQVGYVVFTGLHVPLYALLFWAIYKGDELNQGVIQGLDIFFIVHAFLHLLFLKHPKNEFTTRFSWLIIIGTALSGAVDLLLN